MLFKIACKTIKRNRFMNVIVVIQISIIMIISFITVSSVCSRYTYYNMFKEYFSSKKGFFWVSTDMVNSDMVTMLKSEELMEKFPEAKKAISCHKVWVENSNDNMHYISYDKEIVENFYPTLQKGEWISANSETVEAVVTQNKFGYEVGDKITLFPAFHEDMPIEATIVGVLEENAAIPGFYGEIRNNPSFRHFYMNYNSDYEGVPALIMSYDVLSQYDYLTQQLAYKGFIIFDDSTSDERMSEIGKELSNMNCSYICDTADIKKNSMSYIFGEVYILLPVIISVFILSCTSLISLSAIAVKQELHNYTVFAICGLEWKRCIAINTLASLIMITCSILLTVVLGIFAYVLGITKNMLLIFNFYTISTIILTALIFVLVSTIMPAILIGNLTPKQIIAKE